MKKVEPEYTKYSGVTLSDANYKDGIWEVCSSLTITRTTKDGEDQTLKFEVKSYDKNLNKAQATVQMSANAYFSTHSEDELYGPRKNQTTDIKNPEA